MRIRIIICPYHRSHKNPLTSSCVFLIEKIFSHKIANLLLSSQSLERVCCLLSTINNMIILLTYINNTLPLLLSWLLLVENRWKTFYIHRNCYLCGGLCKVGIKRKHSQLFTRLRHNIFYGVTWSIIKKG